jgi:hypothetical protein
MKNLYTEEEYNKAKFKDKLSLECLYCKKTFYKEKYQITRALKPNSKKKADYCSHFCYSQTLKNKKTILCVNCGVGITRTPQKINRYKNTFCSQKCSGLYNSKNKEYGNNRSKLEIWLEEQLTNLYPSLKILYNDTITIKHELDIYIPSLNIAFELNGIFHYEPIFGIKRLESAQRNDLSKTKACFDAKIDLCVIDTTSQKYFKEKTSKVFLDIITNIINQRT